MKDSKNERLACNAVGKCVEVLTGEARSERRYPDKEKGGDGQVDMIVKLGREEYAIEHTRLEAFEGEIKASTVTIKKVLRLLNERVVGRIPGPSYYSVSFAADCRLPGGIKEEKEALEYVVEWVRKAIETLHERKWCRQGLREQPHVGADWIDMCERKGSFHWEMTVVRWPCPDGDGFKPGTLQLNPLSRPGHVRKWEEEGRKRVERAYGNKVAKLKERKEAGALTILVFESGNIREDLSRGEVRRLAREHREAIDEVYLLEEGPFGWLVVTVKRGDEFHEKELGYVGWHPYEIGSVKVGDISERLGLLEWHMKAFGEEDYLNEVYPSSWDGWRPAIVSENDVCE